MIGNTLMTGAYIFKHAFLPGLNTILSSLVVGRSHEIHAPQSILYSSTSTDK